jgi:adenine phosphoribosyltransferase
LANGEAFFAITEKMASFADSSTFIAGIEARGFIFAAAVANRLHTGFVPIRKAGKLPHVTISESYGLEYGTDTLEIHLDAVNKGAKVLLIDDVLATGGTITAAIELMHRLEAQVVHVVDLLEIDGLSGRLNLAARYPGIPITTFFGGQSKQGNNRLSDGLLNSGHFSAVNPSNPMPIQE